MRSAYALTRPTAFNGLLCPSAGISATVYARIFVMRRLSLAGAGFLRLFAIAGPVLLGLLTALYIARPSFFLLALGAVLAVGVLHVTAGSLRVAIGPHPRR